MGRERTTVPAVFLIVLAAVLAPAAPAAAATFPVTKLGDSFDGVCNADCSLREAIQAANADTTEDEIVLPAGILRVERGDATDPEDANATGDLDVLNDLVIRGAGALNTTIRASLPSSQPDRVLDLLGTGVDLRAGDLTVAGGVGLHRGGGIQSPDNGTLVLERVIVRDNHAYGEAAFGYGGGVYKGTGRLVMTDSAVFGNRGTAPGFGGGIFLNASGASVALTNVTITQNTVGAQGGGIFSNQSIPGELVHVTVTGNEAANGTGAIGGDAADLRLRSSVIAGNSAPTAPNCDMSGGFQPASDGGNVGDPDCGLTHATDVLTLDARLGLLGGSPIPVMEPAADSPALDRAVGACPVADARGVSRPQGAACDAGAAERPVLAPPPPPADGTAPELSDAALTRRRFRVGADPTPLAAQRRRATPAGTVLLYTLSEPATVTLRIERARAGRRARGRCRKPIRRLRSRPRCVRWVRAGRLITRQGAQGANRLPFSGRIGRRALPPSRYRGLLAATDQAGNTSGARRLTFRIVRR